MGNGIPITMLNPAKNEKVPPSPIAWIICGVKSGMENASSERATATDAKAKVGSRNASMTYSCSGNRMDIIPNPKIAAPIIGIIQWTWAWADHPNQRSPIGTNTEPISMPGMRNSGSCRPLFRFMSYIYISVYFRVFLCRSSILLCGT